MMSLPQSLTTKCLAAALVIGLAACGGDPEPEPEERCGVNGLKAYLEGTLESQPFLVSTAGDTPGQGSNREIRIQVGTAVPPDQAGGEGAETLPVILRIFEGDGGQNFLQRLSERLESEGEVQVEVADATDIGPGSQGRTDLSGFDCRLSDDRVCVQLGFDSVGDLTLQDGDEYAYNASGGTVTFLGIDNMTRRVHVRFDLDLGRNVLRFDDESTGAVAGCISPRYRLGTDYWPLE